LKFPENEANIMKNQIKNNPIEFVNSKSKKKQKKGGKH